MSDRGEKDESVLSTHEQKLRYYMFSLPSFSGNTGQESRVFPHIGRRIVKTAIAVFLCLMIYALRGYEVGSMPTEAAITAIICMQPYVKDAGKYALDRLTGSLIGTVWSLLFLVVLMNIPFLSSSKVILYAFMSLGVLLSIYTAVVFRIADTAGLAAIIYICVIAGYPDIDDPLRSAAIRIFDINVGALVAILVNTTHLPRRKNKDRVFFVRAKDLVPDRFSRIPPAALVRLNYLFNDGAKISLISEHAPAFFLLQMREARVTVPMIVMDGAGIYDAGKNEFLYAETIPAEESERIKTRLAALGCSYFIYTIHHNKTCIFHQGKITEQEKIIYDNMKRSPYRNYLEGEVYEPDEVVYYKIIATDGMIAGMEAALHGLLSDGKLRMVIRQQAGTAGLSGLYIYSAAATVEHAENIVMWMLREENPALQPVEIFAQKPYRGEQDAMRLLHSIANEYEPIALLPRREKKEKELQ